MEKLTYAILGGGGFVGNALCRLLLSSGNKVVCMDNFYKGHCDGIIGLNKNANFKFLAGDIRSKQDVLKAIEDADIVVNLAALVGVPMCKNDPFNVVDVNVDGVQNIVNCVVNSDKYRVLLQASTDSVFGSVDVESDEETTPNPQSTYGTSKLEAEKVILRNKFVTYNFRPVILRFSTGMGCSDNMRVNLLVNDLTFTALETKLLTVFEPDVHRTFINVFDMARAIQYFGELTYNKANAHEIYCIGDDSLNYTKRELAELVKSKTGCQVLYIDNQKDPDQRNYKISHKRMYDAGFKCHMSMEETIDELIKTYPSMKFQKKYQ